MTYNFDPERWYENEYSALEVLHKKGNISIAVIDNPRKRVILEFYQHRFR
jgi:hypothetical protein